MQILITNALSGSRAAPPYALRAVLTACERITFLLEAREIDGDILNFSFEQRAETIWTTVVLIAGGRTWRRDFAIGDEEHASRQIVAHALAQFS